MKLWGLCHGPLVVTESPETCKDPASHIEVSGLSGEARNLISRKFLDHQSHLPYALVPSHPIRSFLKLMNFFIKALLRLISAISLASAVLAAYATTEANLSEFSRLHRGKEKGGCDRVAPNGTLMQQKVINDLNKAFSLTEAALAQILKATSLEGARVRGLFKLFFRVPFDSNNCQPNATDGADIRYPFP